MPYPPMPPVAPGGVGGATGAPGAGTPAPGGTGPAAPRQDDIDPEAPARPRLTGRGQSHAPGHASGGVTPRGGAGRLSQAGQAGAGRVRRPAGSCGSTFVR